MGLFRRRSLSKEQPAESVSPTRLFLLRFIKAIGWGTWCLLCAAATAYLFKVSYPNSSYNLLAWFALAPFIMGLLHLRSFWITCLYSWITGTAVYACLYHWVFVTCHTGGDLSLGLSLAAWLGLSGLMALQFVIFGVSCYYLKNLQAFFPWVAACGWVVLEWGHEVLASYFVGFPWFSLSYSQWNAPAILQIASLTGAAGVSFAIAFVEVGS